MAALDHGVGSVVTASGQAALHLAITTILSAGDHIVSSRSVYGGTHNLLEYTLSRFGISTTFVDPRDMRAFADAIIARIRRLGETPEDAEPMTIEDAISFARVHATEYTGAEETYLLTALSLIVQEHFFEPGFFNETTIDAGDGISSRYETALRVQEEAVATMPALIERERQAAEAARLRAIVELAAALFKIVNKT